MLPGGPKPLEDLARFDMSLLGPLREDQRAVNGDFEDTTRGRHHGDIDTRKGFLELSRQPGSSGLVVSLDAELDLDLHDASELWNGSVGILVARLRPAKGALLVIAPQESYL